MALFLNSNFAVKNKLNGFHESFVCCSHFYVTCKNIMKILRQIEIVEKKKNNVSTFHLCCIQSCLFDFFVYSFELSIPKLGYCFLNFTMKTTRTTNYSLEIVFGNYFGFFHDRRSKFPVVGVKEGTFKFNL